MRKHEPRMARSLLFIRRDALEEREGTNDALDNLCYLVSALAAGPDRRYWRWLDSPAFGYCCRSPGYQPAERTPHGCLTDAPATQRRMLYTGDVLRARFNNSNNSPEHPSAFLGHRRGAFFYARAAHAGEVAARCLFQLR